MTARKKGRFCKCGQPLPPRAQKHCGKPECYLCPHGRIDGGRLCVACRGSGICSHLKQRDYCSICDPRGVYRSYRNNARKRSLLFALGFEDFKRIIALPCAYCGQHAGGIDRLDSALGYTLDNAVPCCIADNIAKQSRSKEEYLTHVQRVYHFQKGDLK